MADIARCVITGAGGFIGGYLVERMLEAGAVVEAFDVAEPKRAPRHERYRFTVVDVERRAELERAMRTARPDVVFHLAAQSYPGLSWDDPARTFRANILGTVNVFEAVRASGTGASIVTVCSSAEYAARNTAEPIREDTALEPSSPYGVSKLAADELARLYAERYAMRIVRVRPFYLIGPRKTGDVSSDFARGIVEIERGRRALLSVGNLEVVRDLLDVRDGVEALVLLGERGRAGEVYNICSGRGYAIREVLDIMKKLARAPVREEKDPSRSRPMDEPVKIGDPLRLKALGWSPRYSIEATLGDILDYWRAQEA